MRSETSLVQTIGRAARNADGSVIMYADCVTDSMARAIGETERRRSIQSAYNEAHGIVPKSIIKDVRDVIDLTPKEDKGRRANAERKLSKKERLELIDRLTKEMRNAAKLLEFEHAAYLRDRIESLKKIK